MEQGRFKLYIGIDAQTLQVRAICVISNNFSDAAVMPELLAQVPVQIPLLTITDDRCYETQPVHATVMQRNVTPLRTGMRPSPHVL